MASGPAFSWSHLGLVALGGALGTAARALLLVAPLPLASDVVVALVNVVGAFLLGVVTGILARRAATPRAKAARQFLGTGVLGGFTTYSTFAVDAVTGSPIWLTLATAVVGVAAAGLGLAITARRGRPTGTEAP